MGWSEKRCAGTVRQPAVAAWRQRSATYRWVFTFYWTRENRWTWRECTKLSGGCAPFPKTAKREIKPRKTLKDGQGESLRRWEGGVGVGVGVGVWGHECNQA